MSDKTLGISISFIDDCPSAYRQHLVHSNRLALGEKLIDYLAENSHNKHVISFHTDEKRTDYNRTEYRIYCRITRVQEEFVRSFKYEDVSWEELQKSALGEIGVRIIRWMRGIFHG